MAIVTSQYYAYTYYGEPVAATDWNRFEARAEQLIDNLIYGRVAEYATLPAWQQTAVQNAICAQIEYYAIYGIDVASAGRQSADFTVGKVHVGGGKIATGAASMVCPGAIAILEQTGLMSPQVPAIDASGIFPWGVL